MGSASPGNVADVVLPVTIYSDVVCPWCYVGKRRFEAALATPGMPSRIAISWRPFELNPDMPQEGMDRTAYRARKFGLEKSRELDARMAETGREAGIAFAFDKMKRTPNTRLAHQLIWQAERAGPEEQNALVDRLFAAYFEEGADIGRRDVLLTLALEAGLGATDAAKALDDAQSVEAVLDLEDAGIRMGIRGVPFFLLIGKYGVSGAQPPELWRDALPKIAAEMQGS
ncbi:MAG: DsbA family oxidoreductase [Hyphomicrobiaceae bacterium]|nr:DsbA family oxidoreductase [Hyphomicrobiaceae bacterium]